MCLHVVQQRCFSSLPDILAAPHFYSHASTMWTNQTILFRTFFVLYVALSFGNHPLILYGQEDCLATEYLYDKQDRIRIENGMNVSNKDLSYCAIHLAGHELSRAVFINTALYGSRLNWTSFNKCVFKNADMRFVDASDSNFIDCNFDNARICGATLWGIGKNELCVTYDYRSKAINRLAIQFGIFSKVDFSECDLSKSIFRNTNFSECDFTDATIKDSLFSELSKKQLMSTKDYKSKEILGVTIEKIDLSDVDFSNFNLTGCCFGASNGDFTNTNFTNAVISRCKFDYPYRVGINNKASNNLTLEQIKSTWNYKIGRMEGIVLPKHIQDALDAEKKETQTKRKNEQPTQQKPASP